MTKGISSFVYAFIFIISLSGCAPKVKLTAPEASPSVLNTIRYGMSIYRVRTMLGDVVRPLFKFGDADRTYEVYFVLPKDTDKPYCLLFDGSELVSIFSVQEGRKIWRTVFGMKEESLPEPGRFDEIVDALVEARLDIGATDFSSKGDFEYSRPDAPGVRMSETPEMGVVRASGYLAQFLFGAGELIVAADSAILATGFTVRSLHANIKHDLEKDDYEDLVVRTNKVGLGSTEREVVDVLGEPEATKLRGRGKILYYKKYYSVVLGLSSDKLSWVAYDYDPQLAFKFN